MDGPAAVVPDPLRTPRRMHPAGILIEALRSLREMAIPLVIAIVVGAGAGSSRGLIYGVAGLVLVIVTGLVRWYTTSWSLDGSALHLRTGLLSRNEKVIPRERISSLDTTQGPLQRVFGVLELRVQTPGGGRHAEIVLRAVSRRDAETLRRALGHAAEAAPTPDARLRLTPGTLLVAALTAPQLGVLLPIAGGIAAAGQDVMGNVSRQTFDGLPDTAGQWLLVAAGVIALAWLLSIAGAVVTFAGFEVVRDGDRLRTRSGLFARRAATLPLSRVQGVRMVEGLLREPFGLATLRVETAGYAGQGAVTQTLFPLVRRRDAAAVIDRFVPALAGSLDALQPAPARARRSYLIGPVLLALAVCVLIALAVARRLARDPRAPRARRGARRAALPRGGLAPGRRARRAALARHRALDARGEHPPPAGARHAPDAAAAPQAPGGRHRRRRLAPPRAGAPPRGGDGPAAAGSPAAFLDSWGANVLAAARVPAALSERRHLVARAGRGGDRGDRCDPCAHRHGRRRDPALGQQRAAHARPAHRRRRHRALGPQRRPATRRGARLARRRAAAAPDALRPPAVAGARVLRPPADRPAHVAGHRRPAVRAVLPRLRPRLDPAVGADDLLHGGRDGHHRPAARGHRAESRSPSSSGSPPATAGARGPRCRRSSSASRS